jgi:hypothetical protein
MNRIKGGINKPRGQLETKTTDTKRDQAGENITQRQEVLNGTCHHPPKDDTGSHSYRSLHSE